MDLSPLTSWTRTLNEEDALDLLERTEPGEPIEAWTERADDSLPQGSPERRGEIIRMTRRHLLDVEDGRVADTRYLRLIREGNAQTRLHLLYGRYLYENAWIDRALTELIHPAIQAHEAPLGPEEADLVRPEAWEAFIARHIKPGSGSTSVKKTLTVLMRNLSRLGVVQINAERETRVARGEPSRLAFGWLVNYELRARRLGEMALHLAAKQTRAAHLFAPTPAYAEQCLIESIDAGLLKEGHLVGQARIYEGDL